LSTVAADRLDQVGERKTEGPGIARAAGAISCGVFASRILGFVRDMLIAKFFGAGTMADAFFVAFRIPSTLRELFGEGALSASFVPVFTETLNRKGKQEAWRLARATGSFLAAMLIVVSAAGIIAAPAIVWIMAPGFHVYPEKLSLTVFLTRITFPYILFVGIAALFMGILNSLRRYTAPAFAPTMLNLAMIGSVLFLSPLLNPPITSLAIGVLLGGIGQMAIQIPDLRREGGSLSLDFSWRDPALRRIGKLMLPGLMGLIITQANFFISTFLASFLKEGSVSFLYYSFRLVQIPIGLVGVALGTAILPFLSSSVARGSLDELNRITIFALRVSLFITIPITFGMIIFRRALVTVLFERGQFTPSMSREVAETLLYLSLGICFYVGDRILVSAFYSLQDTRTPMVISAIAVGVDIFCSILLMGPFQVRGLALATSLASLSHFTFLVTCLRKRVGRLGGGELRLSIFKIILSAVPMALFCHFLVESFPPWEQPRLLSRVVSLAGEMGAGGVAYLVLALFTGSEEAKYLVERFHKVFAQAGRRAR